MDGNEGSNGPHSKYNEKNQSVILISDDDEKESKEGHGMEGSRVNEESEEESDESEESESESESEESEDEESDEDEDTNKNDKTGRDNDHNPHYIMGGRGLFRRHLHKKACARREREEKDFGNDQIKNSPKHSVAATASSPSPTPPPTGSPYSSASPSVPASSLPSLPPSGLNAISADDEDGGMSDTEKHTNAGSGCTVDTRSLDLAIARDARAAIVPLEAATGETCEDENSHDLQQQTNHGSVNAHQHPHNTSAHSFPPLASTSFSSSSSSSPLTMALNLPRATPTLTTTPIDVIDLTSDGGNVEGKDKVKIEDSGSKIDDILDVNGENEDGRNDDPYCNSPELQSAPRSSPLQPPSKQIEYKEHYHTRTSTDTNTISNTNDDTDIDLDANTDASDERKGQVVYLNRKRKRKGKLAPSPRLSPRRANREHKPASEARGRGHQTEGSDHSTAGTLSTPEGKGKDVNNNNNHTVHNQSNKKLKKPRQPRARMDEIHVDDIKFGEKIGEGSFGEVYRGSLWGQEVALKKMRIKVGSDMLVEI